MRIEVELRENLMGRNFNLGLTSAGLGKVVFAAIAFLFVAGVVSLILPNGSLVKPAFALDDVETELTPLQRGRGKAQLCTRCHGRIGMQRAVKRRDWEGSIQSFVVLNLTQFRDGTRMHAIMNSVAGPLTDLDISDVAIWYNSIPYDKKP